MTCPDCERLTARAEKAEQEAKRLRIFAEGVAEGGQRQRDCKHKKAAPFAVEGP